MLLISCQQLFAQITDYSKGKAAFCKGDPIAAQGYWSKAHSKNVSDIKTKMAYAKVAPCSVSLKILKEVAGSQTASDSIKAAANIDLGDYASALQKYEDAKEYYKKASKLSKNAEARFRWAQVLIESGDYTGATSLLNTLTLEHNGEIAMRAQYELGVLMLKQKQYSQAFDYFLGAGNLCASCDLSTQLLVGKTHVAAQLGMVDKFKSYKMSLKKIGSNYLEKSYVDNVTPIIKEITPGASVIKSDTIKTNNISAKFCLQVGAFGSLANAEKMQSTLLKQFKEVSIAPLEREDQTLYRVRIGKFTTREQAQAFADSGLQKMSYRIVEQ